MNVHSLTLRTVGIAALALATATPAYAAGDHPTGQRDEHGKPAGHNPTGNNGTVFIHDVAGDESPHNVPHVACDFWVDLFGFDAGQEVTVSFAGQAPTGKDTPLGGTWTGVAGDDDAGGAGNDFDLELAFTADDLGVTSLGDPHPQQGYHVKMTVDTGEPGGHKYKVFWIEPCASEETPVVAPTEDTTGSDTENGGTETGGTSSSGVTTHQTHGSTTTRQHQPRNAALSTEVLGEHVTRGSDSPEVIAVNDTLPFTGSRVPVGLLAWLGAGGVALGGALVAAGRRRRVGVGG